MLKLEVPNFTLFSQVSKEIMKSWYVLIGNFSERIRMGSVPYYLMLAIRLQFNWEVEDVLRVTNIGIITGKMKRSPDKRQKKKHTEV